MNNYLLCACLKDVITTPTLLEHCGMCGSCCIEALVDIVLRLTPPREPISTHAKRLSLQTQWIKINPLKDYIIKCVCMCACNVCVIYVSSIYLSAYRMMPSHHRFPKISSAPGAYQRMQKISSVVQVFSGQRTFGESSVDSFFRIPFFENWNHLSNYVTIWSQK